MPSKHCLAFQQALPLVFSLRDLASWATCSASSLGLSSSDFPFFFFCKDQSSKWWGSYLLLEKAAESLDMILHPEISSLNLKFSIFKCDCYPSGKTPAMTDLLPLAACMGLPVFFSLLPEPPFDGQPSLSLHLTVSGGLKGSTLRSPFPGQFSLAAEVAGRVCTPAHDSWYVPRQIQEIVYAKDVADLHEARVRRTSLWSWG